MYFCFIVNRKLFETIHVLNLNNTHWIHKTPLIQGLNWELSIWTRQRVLWKTTQHSNTADIATQQLTNTATGAQQLLKLQHSSRETQKQQHEHSNLNLQSDTQRNLKNIQHSNLKYNATWTQYNTADKILLKLGFGFSSSVKNNAEKYCWNESQNNLVMNLKNIQITIQTTNDSPNKQPFKPVHTMKVKYHQYLIPTTILNSHNH